MNKLSIVFFLVLAACLPGLGQKILPSPSDLYDEALEYIFAGEYSEALPVLKSLEDKGYHTANVSYKIGECYLNIPGQKTYAIPYLKDATQKISANYAGNTLEEEFAPVKSLLFLGIAYRLDNDINNALACFNSYLSKIDDVETNNRALAEYHIERCNNALELIASPAIFAADTLSDIINSVVSNSNPLLTPDEKVMYYMNQLKFYDAVMRATQSDTSWQIPENLTPEIKSDGDHYITGISASGNRLFLTFYDPYRSGEIFTTELKDGKWAELSRLNDKINTLFNESHASLSPDGKYLYLTSDRKGGIGGLDIYRSSVTPSGEWSDPVNLGPLVNTPYNEESPFVTSNSSKLFFSSQGHYNMGGYDVFFSDMDHEGNWLPPVNIGFPLNTTDDDLFFFPVDSGNIAYQSRFSNNTARQDILRYTIHSFGNPARFTVSGKVNLKSDPDYSPGNISIAFIDRTTEDTLALQRLHRDGSFTQKLPGGWYNLNFSDETQLLLTRELSIPDYFPHPELILNTDITVPSRFVADTLILKDIRFAFDKSQIEEQYLSYLDEIAQKMIKYPGITLRLNGYADSKGNDSYNKKLSLTRARVIQDYLQNKASFADRISVDGFGEENPLSIETNADGTDNPQGRSYNRRAELLISGSNNELIVIRFRDIPENLMRK
ncbi:MAG: OmpA family protein [Bacteroidales bacterium]|nr:OmpA family protein [Bacteroidales bacterium]